MLKEKKIVRRKKVREEQFWRWGAGIRKPETRNQKPETRNQNPESRIQKYRIQNR